MTDDRVDRLTDRLSAEEERHPVAAGLIALVGVGLVVGLFAGLAVFAGTRMLGLGGVDASAETTARSRSTSPSRRRPRAPAAP